MVIVSSQIFVHLVFSVMMGKYFSTKCINPNKYVAVIWTYPETHSPNSRAK